MTPQQYCAILILTDQEDENWKNKLCLWLCKVYFMASAQTQLNSKGETKMEKRHGTQTDGDADAASVLRLNTSIRGLKC